MRVNQDQTVIWRAPRGTFWTEERIEKLKEHWAEGFSASQISGLMGAASRSAIIGKVHRLGLSGRIVKTRKIAKRRRPSRLASLRNFTPRPTMKLASYTPPPPSETDVARVSFNQLDKTHCKWIIGDPSELGQDQPMFCGAERVEGLPYCRDHAIRALDPVKLRKAGIVVSQEKTEEYA
jgi:GcrA cell cycle regulator